MERAHFMEVAPFPCSSPLTSNDTIFFFFPVGGSLSQGAGNDAFFLLFLLLVLYGHCVDLFLSLFVFSKVKLLLFFPSPEGYVTPLSVKYRVSHPSPSTLTNASEYKVFPSLLSRPKRLFSFFLFAVLFQRVSWKRKVSLPFSFLSLEASFSTFLLVHDAFFEKTREGFICVSLSFSIPELRLQSPCK